ncbi:MAG: homocysteine S-methyltransferase family protein [Candidatus Eisenbacteria bacterium]
MKSIRERLAAGEVLVADGAMGTALMKEDLGAGTPLEAIHLERAEIVERITREFVLAGADLVQTNTFGAHPANLARYGLENRCEEIVGSAIRVARRAAGDRAAVFLSVGPSTRILRPYGDAAPEEIAAGFRRVIAAAMREGVDLVVVETMTDPLEAAMAVKAAAEEDDSVPVAATMTFDETPRGFYTIMGTSIEQAIRQLEDGGAEIVGSNCGNGTAKMVEIAREFRDLTDLPLIIQSNAGLPEIREGAALYMETPDLFGARTLDFLGAGVSILGGCCGTTPAHTAAIRAAVDAFRKAT